MVDHSPVLTTKISSRIFIVSSRLKLGKRTRKMEKRLQKSLRPVSSITLEVKVCSIRLDPRTRVERMMSAPTMMKRE
jgi:hypothetical protein